MEEDDKENAGIASNSISWKVNYEPANQDLEELDQDNNETTAKNNELTELVDAYDSENEERSEAPPGEDVVLTKVEKPPEQSIATIERKLGDLSFSLEQIKNELNQININIPKFESFYEKLEAYNTKLEEVERKSEAQNKNKLKDLILASSFGAGVAIVGTGTAYYATGKLPQELITVAFGSVVVIGSVTASILTRLKKSLGLVEKVETETPSSV